jgi:dTDP-4-dehydrorhamnose 3,5-epimerase
MTEIPDGCVLRELNPHADERGIFTEMFRDEWATGVTPVQWNCVRSEASVLRGIHVHLRHSDYLVLVDGHASVGLRDLRPGSEARACAIEMDGSRPQALSIPPGVAHGFLFHTPSIHVYAVSLPWDPADELGCHWDDPDLGIPWPQSTPVLSERDEALPSLHDLVASLDGQLAA